MHVVFYPVMFFMVFKYILEFVNWQRDEHIN
jgi:hypothetical protein